jgi:hypothetical protein
MQPTVILVGADKGGVGKTTISRALLDFLARRSIATRAFDTENPRGTLNRFFPASSEIINLANVADQMKILDTLSQTSAQVTLVDFKAGNLSMALDTFEKIGVLEAARDGAFRLGLVHVIGPAIASLGEIGEVASYVRGLDYIIARNFINETNFFEWDDKTYKKYFANLKNTQDIEIPKLNEMAYEQVDLAGVTFNDFVENRSAAGGAGDFSFVLRGYVRRWMMDIAEQFEQLNLLKAVAGDSAEVKPKTGPVPVEEMAG